MLDYHDLFLIHDAEQQAALDKCPVCSHCDEPIQDDFLYDIEGVIYCQSCVNELFRRWIEVE